MVVVVVVVRLAALLGSLRCCSLCLSLVMGALRSVQLVTGLPATCGLMAVMPSGSNALSDALWCLLHTRQPEQQPCSPIARFMLGW